MFVKAAILSAFAAFAATSAFAIDNYTIPETIDQSAVSIVDRPVDIIGIKPGMTASDALAILAKDYGGEDNIDRFHMKIGTRQVQSQQFDTFYTGGDILKAGIAEVYLASPAAGNKVFAARRVVNLKVEDGLPTVAAMKAQLVEKYGKPSAEEKSNDRLTKMFWYLGDKGVCTEKYDACTTSYDGGSSGGAGGVLGSYDVSKTEDYEKAATFGSDIVVVAEIITAYGYPDGVNELTVSFVDLKLRAKSARADYDLVFKKQAEFDSKAVAAPKL
ncbi:hypothetical protein [Rhizobium sp. BK176]|uniref:hypothetical protein n=1 Tax=Rhizobium sp. BK176 TaxID=2587071 RepID=UPI0021683F22|nr:hypothetical protein [Rhizobium sp. BK176]MCS4088785.1 hypothetical protein [Rhizobium sp. BK176]